MEYVSLFTGIDAVSVAWKDLGWKAVAFSEIEKFPNEVLAHHYPDVPNLGNVIEADWDEWNGKADLVVGGSPCQSFSIAGKRLGMEDPRGNLALHFLRVIDSVRPTWFVFENVPGLLSSEDGRDFGTFLGEVGKLGYGFAYRVLDARFFGVAQRRRRVFVVGHIGGDWRSAAAVLFERESLCRDSKKSNTAGEGAPTDAGCSTEEGWGSLAHDRGRVAESSPKALSPALTAKNDVGHMNREQAGAVLEAEAETTIGFYPTNRQPEHGNYEEVSPTIKVGSGGEAGNPPGVAQKEPTNLEGGDTMRTISAKPDRVTSDGEMAGVLTPFNENRIGEHDEEDVAATLSARDKKGGKTVVAFTQNQRDEVRDLGDESGALTGPGSHHTTMVAQDNPSFGIDEVGVIRTGGDFADPTITIDDKAFLAANPMSDREMAVFDARGYGDGKTVSTMVGAHNAGVGDFTALAVRTANTQANGIGIAEEHTHTLDGAQGQAVAFKFDALNSNSMKSKNPHSGLNEVDVSMTLDCFDPSPAKNQGGIAIIQPDPAVLAPTLTASNDPSRSPQSSEITKQVSAVHESQMVVRRLTPIECERLQGFPDDYTRIPYRNKPAEKCPDGPRYKALGNSMAVPVMRWIADGIVKVEKVMAEIEDRPDAVSVQQTTLDSWF